MTAPVLVWLRQDLRLADQPAFRAAAARGPVVPVYVLDDDTPGHWAIGGAQRWWLHHSLASLSRDLEARGSRLVLRRGRMADAIARVAKEVGAGEVHACRHYEPWHQAAERDLAARLDLRLHDGVELHPHREIKALSGQPFRVFAAYWRALQPKLPPAEPLPAPDLATPAIWPASDDLNAWALLPTRPNWAAEFPDHWQPGEAGAIAKLERFADGVPSYADRRNLPSDEGGTSALSAHLHHGEISPATVFHRAAAHGRDVADKFLKELTWRDFTLNLIDQVPSYGDEHIRPVFERLPFRDHESEAAADLRAWKCGETGYPIVDAGMRQLWRIGWMHNRVRMITASFLVKHLLIDWRVGARVFWDRLVDADYANNSFSWQWIAGSGFDPNAWGRIMAPLTQSAKFGAADYIRRWVPELSGLTDEEIHDPDAFGARPSSYPPKIIAHRDGRARALQAGRALAKAA